MKKLSTEALHLVAAHEAGHGVAYIRAYQKMGRHWPAFHQVLIKPDFSEPYVDWKGRECSDCAGLVEASDVYALVGGRRLWDAEPDIRPRLKAAMEWDIIVSLAGPFAEAIARGYRGKSTILSVAIVNGGAGEDFERAENVLKDWKWATKERAGLHRFGERTRELVLSEWPAIEALAAALLKRNVLSYEEALDAIGESAR